MTSPSPTPPPSRGGCPVLIGRRTQLDALRAVTALRPSAVLIEGEAGVGKSRLVLELLSTDLGPASALVGHCRQGGEPFPYGVVLEALCGARDLLALRPPLSPVSGVLRAYLPEIADFLPDPPPPIGDPRAERHRLFRAVGELLGALGPVLLVVEDVQWADDGSRQLLRFLMSDPSLNLTTLVTYRREEVPGGIPLDVAYRPPPGVVNLVLELGPLSREEVGELTGAVIGTDRVSEAFVAKLHERSAGIPYVVEETLRALHSPADAARADSSTAHRLLEAVATPVLLRQAMVERLSALPLAAVRLVQAAAVLGTPATPALICVVAGVPETRLRAALTHALHGHVLCEADRGRYHFRHALARQAAYDTIPATHRAHLHARAADALTRCDPLPLTQLAHHSERAGRMPAWRAYAEAAADRAVQVGDTATAFTLLHQLIDDPGSPGHDVDRLAVKLARAARLGIDHRDAGGALERLLADPRLAAAARGEVALCRGFLLHRRLGSLRAARTEIENALPHLAERPDLAERAMSVLAQPFVGTVPVGEVTVWMERARAVREHAVDARRIAVLANELGSRMHLGEPGLLARLADVPQRADTREGRQDLARLWANLADGCSWVGHTRKAGQFLDAGTRLAVESSADFVLCTARTTRIRLDWLTGSWDGLAERAARLLDEHHDLTTITSELSLVIGRLAIARARWAEAARHLRATGALCPEEAITTVAVAGCAGLAWAHLSRGEPHEAARHADRGTDALRRKGTWVWAGDLVPIAVAAYLAADREPDAAHLITEVAHHSADRDAPHLSPALATARGLLLRRRGDLTEARDHFRQAADRYASLPNPYLAARATEREAICLHPADPEKSATLIAAAIATFDALDATHDAARCRHHLRRMGGTRQRRSGRPGYGNTLSPREQEVARLLLDGHTNREIGVALFLSHRTVEQHVARIFRKRGVNSRAQLQSALARP